LIPFSITFKPSKYIGIKTDLNSLLFRLKILWMPGTKLLKFFCG